jgi:hypothetical protein
METLIAPEKIIDLAGISKMSLAQRIAIIEAIENTMTGEMEAMGFPPDDAEDAGKDDITLAEEALAEYRADPSKAIDGETFFKQLYQKYGLTKNL